MKKITVLLCVLSTLLLSACKPSNLHQNGTEAPQQGIQPSTQASTQTSTQATTQAPAPSTAPTEDPLCLEMDALFGDRSNWYNKALTCTYDDSKNISLKALFYGGFKGESQDPTDAEWAELKDQPGFREEYDLMRLPKDKMNQVLTTYFGITLEDVADTGFEGLVYLESTGCYYHMVTGANSVEDFEATQVEVLDDGALQVYYTSYGDNLVVTLRPNGDEYQIISNKEV